MMAKCFLDFIYRLAKSLGKSLENYTHNYTHLYTLIHTIIDVDKVDKMWIKCG